MRYCRNCGKGISKDVKFCPYCGAKVDPAAEVKEKGSTQITPAFLKETAGRVKAPVKSGKPVMKRILRLAGVVLLIIIAVSIIRSLYENHQEKWLNDVASYYWVEEPMDGSKTDLENDEFSYLNFDDDGSAFGLYLSYSSENDQFKCEPDRERQIFSVDDPGKYGYKEIALVGNLSDIGDCYMLAYPADGSHAVTYRPYSKDAYKNVFAKFP